MKKSTKTISILLITVLIAFFTVPATAGTGKVNINSDGKEILMTMKYIGEKLAERIIKYRKATPFKAPKDIMNVKGIGTKVFKANKTIIIVKKN